MVLEQSLITRIHYILLENWGFVNRNLKVICIK